MKKKREKKLTTRLKNHAGRSRSGQITTKHKGGGVKKLYRLVDFGQSKKGIKGKVIDVQYDPYRTAAIILIEYPDGDKKYRIAPHKVEKGNEVIIDEKTEAEPGNRMKLKNVPVGIRVFNVSFSDNGEGKMVRSAGSSAEVLGQKKKYTHLKMPSGEIRKVHGDGWATVGRVSNPEHRFEEVGKAGSKRRKGVRPTVRGTAMQAGHPHAGGEGKTSIGLKHPKTPWGKIAHGGKTRRRKHTDKYIVKHRNR